MRFQEKELQKTVRWNKVNECCGALKVLKQKRGPDPCVFDHIRSITASNPLTGGFPSIVAAQNTRCGGSLTSQNNITSPAPTKKQQRNSPQQPPTTTSSIMMIPSAKNSSKKQ